jgi:hypothetical protein
VFSLRFCFPVIRAQGVQRHVTLKHDLDLASQSTGEIPACAGMTIWVGGCISR